MKLAAGKILVFALLLGVFYGLGSFDLLHGAFDTPIYLKQNPIIHWVMISSCFVYGTVVAVWGDKTSSIIHPVSFRPGYIMVGIVLILAALLLTFFVRFVDNCHANKPIGVSAVHFTVAVPFAKRALLSFPR